MATNKRVLSGMRPTGAAHLGHLLGAFHNWVAMQAERETIEELGVDLTNASQVRRLGQLSDVLGHAESIRVSAFVYGISGDPMLRPNHEVHQAFWTPLHHCTDSSRQAVREFSYLDVSMPLPTIRLLEDENAPLLWGITYKFMDEFMSMIGRPIPFMPWQKGDRG